MADSIDVIDQLRRTIKDFPSNLTPIIGTLIIIFLEFYFSPAIKTRIPDDFQRNLLYIFVITVFNAFWFYIKYSLPKTKKNRVGLVISIRAENDKQKIKLKNDLIKRLKDLIIENNLDDLIDLILLKNHQADLLTPVLIKHSAIIKKIIETGERPQKKELRKWIKSQKRIRGHFYVFGDIKVRKHEGGENYYEFDLSSLVLHDPKITPSTRKKIYDEFNSVWFKKILFPENEEIKGFTVTADMVYLASKYIVGIAAFVSRDPFLALKLHQGLINDFNKFPKLSPKLDSAKKETARLIASEAASIAIFYEKKNDITNAKKYLEISLDAEPKNIDALAEKSIIDLKYDKNPDEALKTIHEAQEQSNNVVLQYNEAFVLMYQENFDKALNIYDKIGSDIAENEDKVLEQVYQFNINFLEKNPEKIQSLFIIGILKYKKDKNYPESLSYFDKFIIKASSIRKFKPLLTRAKAYKRKLEKKMKI